MSKLNLAFGLNAVLTDKAVAAWGARMIVNQDGYVDFLPDRTDFVGSEAARADLLDRLERFPLWKVKAAIKTLLVSGEMQTREYRIFTLYDESGLQVMASTQASAGYCYVTAFINERSAAPC